MSYWRTSILWIRKFELDEAYFGGERKGNRGHRIKNETIVFSILERKGRV